MFATSMSFAINVPWMSLRNTIASASLMTNDPPAYRTVWTSVVVVVVSTTVLATQFGNTAVPPVVLVEVSMVAHETASVIGFVAVVFTRRATGTGLLENTSKS